MALQDSTIHWLSIRVRIICVAVFLFSGFFPPYVPKSALALQETSTFNQQFLLVEEGFLMKSSSLTKQGARRAYAEGVIHTVKEGESLEKIAQRYTISKDTIRWANKLKEDQPIQPKQELLILPVDGVLHTVKAGQTLLGIADLYGISADVIAQQNRVEGGFLLAGQELIIPGGKPIVSKPTVIAAATSSAGKKPTTAKPQTGPTPHAKEMTAEVTSGVLQKPCSSICFVTQYFNPNHYALDLQEKGGGPIYAAEAGTVIRADYGWQGGYGNVIEIDHGNGLVTLYGHNKELYVKAGDTVERGQLISWMGNTGLVYGATGIHLHFEVRVDGVKKNPLLYIQ
ncbi:MAG: peptidoglycan DD-metalloendopeptidase family protein [Candidatus Peribacteraceae bacterium]|nr:peptidoglycan DD-metalloendopeptidase family protein [Candidatus Peribacteraceae bacterium]